MDRRTARPSIPENMRCKIAWVCSDRDSYEHAHRWMEESGRMCTMEL